jgi:hypothetical protein
MIIYGLLLSCSVIFLSAHLELTGVLVSTVILLFLILFDQLYNLGILEPLLKSVFRLLWATKKYIIIFAVIIIFLCKFL